MGLSYSTNKYGWRRDKPDERDVIAHFSKNKAKYFNGISDVDLRPKCPAVYDQGQLGSCTANGIGAVYQFDESKQGNTSDFVPSRLFIYYNERAMEGTVSQDAGAEIRDGIKSINTTGVCPETDWPYDISKFTYKPTQNCYDIAKNDRSLKYRRVQQSLDQIKLALSEGFPIVFGFMVYSSFESQQVSETGIVPYPKPDETLLGGHCVVIVGFKEKEKQFIVRNSWGASWGDEGYCYFPYKFILNPNLASDFWIVESVTKA